MRTAKTHHKSSAAQEPEANRATMEKFIVTAKAPVAFDYGDAPLALVTGSYSLEVRAGRLLLEAWNESRSLSRRIVSVDQVKPGALDCTVQRFGGALGKFRLLDLERPQSAIRALQAGRQSFAEQFRRMLQRQLPAWETKAVTAALDLRRSFSATFPRAHLQRGTEHIAALACPTLENEPGLMTSALLWFDYLRERLRRGERLSLCLFLPEQAGGLTAHRLRWLTGRPLQARLFRFNEHGMAGEVDARDLGNLETRVSSQYAPLELPAELEPGIARLTAKPDVECCPEIDGGLSLRFRGLEFARIKGEHVWLGIEGRTEIGLTGWKRLEEFANYLASIGGGDELPRFPEKHLEGAVRRNLNLLEPDLIREPVHGQVLTFAGGTRETLDLLAVSRSGQLAILELKTVEDLQLPMQALDYWARIGWHLERGELDALFPGRALARVAPKLLLVAPALSFHPANEIVLRYFSAEIPVQRVGVNSEWEAALRVVLRLEGAEQPISHRSTQKGRNDTRRTGQYQEGNRDSESA